MNSNNSQNGLKYEKITYKQNGKLIKRKLGAAKYFKQRITALIL